jgi:hypothetical protein
MAFSHLLERWKSEMKLHLQRNVRTQRLHAAEVPRNKKRNQIFIQEMNHSTNYRNFPIAFGDVMRVSRS